MNKKLVGLLSVSLLAAPVSVFAGSEFKLRPYVGADAQWRYQTYQKNFGGNIFKKSMPQGNLFVGATFNDYVGVELGYSSTRKIKRDARLLPGQFLTGILADGVAGNFLDVHTTSKIHGSNINVVGFLPIAFEDCLQLVGSLGVAHLNLKFTTQRVATDQGPLPDPKFRSFSQRKVVARVGGGIQHFVTEAIGIRAMINWENTGKFKDIRAKEHTLPSIRMKDAWTYNLGFFFKF